MRYVRSDGILPSHSNLGGDGTLLSQMKRAANQLATFDATRRLEAVTTKFFQTLPCNPASYFPKSKSSTRSTSKKSLRNCAMWLWIWAFNLAPMAKSIR